MDKPSATVNVTLARNVSIAILVGVVLGAAVGVGLLYFKLDYNPREKMFAGYLGELLFQMFHCVAMPLVISSIICAVAYIHYPNISWWLGIEFITVLLVTKFLAILVTLPATLFICPGKGLQISTEDHNTYIIYQNLAESVLDMVRNTFPVSVIRMAMQHQVTNVTMDENNKPNINKLTRNGCNWLGLVMISSLIGFALHTIDPKMESPLLCFFSILTRITTVILHGIIRVAPVLVISTVVGQMVFARTTQHLIEASKYCGIMFLAMFLQMFVFYPILIAVVARRNPLKEYRSFWMPFLIAGATGSSLTAIPLCSFPEEYDPEIVKTMLPLSVILNKDGSCIFFVAATLSSILYNGGKLGVANCIVTSLLAIPLSIACPGIPQGGMLMLPLALMGNSIQYHDMAVVLVMDWLVDRCLTLVNVAGSIVMLAILNKWNVEYIDKLLHEDQIQLQQLKQAAEEYEKQQAEQVAEDRENANKS